MSEIPESALKYIGEVRMARKYQDANIQDCTEDEMEGAGYVRVKALPYTPEWKAERENQLALGNALTWSTKWEEIVIVWRKNI